MTTMTLKRSFVAKEKKKTVPATGRGRALLTVDWYLNGSPTLYNYDRPDLVLGNIQAC